MSALGFGARLALQPGVVAGTGFDFAGGGLPAGASLTRASAGTRVNAAGVLVSEAADVPRFDHDPVTLAPRGLLVEPARTNLIARSAELSASPWAVYGTNGLTITANAAAGLDGTMSAERCVANAFAGTGVATLYNGPQSITDPILSVHLRGEAGGEELYLLIQGTPDGPRIALTAAYQRFAYQRAGSASYFGWGVHGSRPGSTATAAASYVAWGAQVEVAGAGERQDASSYIPTTTAAATRAADVLTLNWGSRGAADGAITVRYTFDDGSTQDVATTVAGGMAAVPTNLARARVRRAARVA